MKQKDSKRTFPIYDQFRSNDPMIDFLMSEKGQYSLDKQILTMMKDMDSEQIIQFSTQFFKKGQNQCESLQKIIGNELTSRINLEGGSGKIQKLQVQQIQAISAQQPKYKKQLSPPDLDSLNVNLMKNLRQIEKITNENYEHQDDIQIEAVCAENQQKKPNYLFQNCQNQPYHPSVAEDGVYLTEDGSQHFQDGQNELHFQSEFPTTIQQNEQADFQEIQRISLSDSRFRITYNNGDIYEGQLDNDTKNGWGEYFYSTGQRYCGFFQDDQIQGYGRYFFLSGAEYEGDWSSGMKHGTGILKFSNKDAYEGSFVNDLFHGKGVYKHANGDIFNGIWKEGLRNGKGTFQGIDGSLKIGTWVNDKFQI